MNAERPLDCLPQLFRRDRKAAPPNDAASFAELEFHPHPIGNGVQARVLYPNGYGASIVKSHGSHGGDDGLYELAVLCTGGEGLRITYDTPITDDVIGWLTPERVSELMAQVAALPLCRRTEMGDVDNPIDHEHSDYAKGIGAALLFAMFVLLVCILALDWRYDAYIGDLQRRQDVLGCQIAPDETRCLRELVEGKE